jgi:hypothetical protein
MSIIGEGRFTIVNSFESHPIHVQKLLGFFTIGIGASSPKAGFQFL